MKTLTMLLICLATFVACSDKKGGDNAQTSNDIPTRSEGKKLDLPYPLERVPDWEKGDDNNVPIAMNFLKCYEMKDFVTMKTYLADTVEFIFDNGNFRGSRDQMVKFMKNFRENRLEVKIDMNDYESVRSKNRNQEYVSLWYIEKITDKQGKQDSAFVMDDYRINGGKISMIDTKFRHLRNGN